MILLYVLCIIEMISYSSIMYDTSIWYYALGLVLEFDQGVCFLNFVATDVFCYCMLFETSTRFNVLPQVCVRSIGSALAWNGKAPILSVFNEFDRILARNR
jgi:hypothetical protein